jgi:hypothetical protein
MGLNSSPTAKWQNMSKKKSKHEQKCKRFWINLQNYLFPCKTYKKNKINNKKRPMIWQKLAGKGSRYVQKNQVEVLDKI